MGKEKYQTSPKEKAIDNEFTEWHEVCELYVEINKLNIIQVGTYLLYFLIFFFRQIPKQGNTAELILSVLHRNFLGLDQFLGQTTIPLAEIDVYERPKSKYVFS